MNREGDNDTLDDTLRLRRAIAAPHRFTDLVLARLKTERQASRAETIVAAYGVQAGIAAAALGVWLAVDVNAAAAKLTDALQAPNAAPVTGIVAICLVWALIRREPEGDAP